MATPRFLNPTHKAEGDSPSISPYGQALHKARKQGPLTVLYHKNLMFPDRFGDSPYPFTLRPSLPYPNESAQGPTRLGPEEDNNE